MIIHCFPQDPKKLRDGTLMEEGLGNYLQKIPEQDKVTKNKLEHSEPRMTQMKPIEKKILKWSDPKKDLLRKIARPTSSPKTYIMTHS